MPRIDRRARSGGCRRKRIVEEAPNVRQAEALAHDEGVPERKPQKARGGKVKDADTIALEKRRQRRARARRQRRSTAIPAALWHIRYSDLEQLDEIFATAGRDGLETPRFLLLSACGEGRGGGASTVRGHAPIEFAMHSPTAARQARNALPMRATSPQAER